MSNVDHIGIWTNDLEKEKEFFISYFGCTANEKYINQGKNFSSYFLSFPGGSGIEIMRKPGIMAASGNETAGISHIAIDVGSRDKVDQLVSRAEEDGLVIAGRPRVTGDGYYESVILDPEGNRIEIISIC